MVANRLASVLAASSASMAACMNVEVLSRYVYLFPFAQTIESASGSDAR